MKKVLALGLVSLALVQAKVFLGVQGGYDLGVGLTKTGTLDAPIWKGATTGGWSAGANLGLEHGEGFFGVRYFLSFDYSAPLSNSDVYKNLNVFDVDLNLDLLLNFVHGGSFGFGMFLGTGVGYQYAFFKSGTNNAQSSFGAAPIFGRAGLTFALGEHSRFDVGVKIPIIAFGIHRNKNHVANLSDPNYYSPLKIQASYRFLF